MEMKKSHMLRNRFIVTIFMLAIYLLCRNIPLYNVAITNDGATTFNAQTVINTMLSGDKYYLSIMALGIMPYINASLVTQIFIAIRGREGRALISKQKSQRWMRNTTIVFALFMAIIKSFDYTFINTDQTGLSRLIVIVEMFVGAMLTYKLCIDNDDKGIGASMPFILVNILSSSLLKIHNYNFFSYTGLLIVCLVVMVITLFMENKIVKLPLQRVSIHNIHADKNYIAYKLNPVGIMPVMFAASMFIVIGYIFRFLMLLFPQITIFGDIWENLTLTNLFGVIVYLSIIIVLSVVFAFIMLNPSETAYQLQKNGDSIVDVYAGKKTTNYLILLVLKLSLLSGLIQAACMSVSLVWAIQGTIPSALSMSPSVVMILVSILCGLGHEIVSYRQFDAYQFFM